MVIRCLLVAYKQQQRALSPPQFWSFGLKPGELIRGYKSKPEGWLEKQYMAHNDAVKKHVPKNRLLVFNVKDGWEPLCEFLSKEVPHVPFPNVNESQELKRATKIMKIVSYGWIPFLAGTGYVISLAIKSAMTVIQKPTLI